jgi:hypothetical protein
MRLFFLIPLATGVLSSYVSLTNKEDISYIFGVIAGGSLILSLILAPWEIQLLILLLGIINIRQLWLKSSSHKDQQASTDLSPDQVSTQDKMNLALTPFSQAQSALQKISRFLERKAIAVQQTSSDRIAQATTAEENTKVKYRGVELNVEQKLNSLEAVENNEVVGKYRGLPVKGHSFAHQLTLKKKKEIKYRGIPLESTDPQD